MHCDPFRVRPEVIPQPHVSCPGRAGAETPGAYLAPARRDTQAAHQAGGEKAQRGAVTRTPSRARRCSWRGGPCGRSRSSVLSRLAPPYCPSVSQARGPCVSRGEGRADTESFAPILRWGENRELLVYFITSGTDQFPQAIAASKTAEACSQAPVC